MSALTRWTGGLGALALCVALAGLLLASAWYHDDACPIEGWKCDAGGIGLSLLVYGGLAAALLLLLFAASAIASAVRRRRASAGSDAG